MDKLDAERAFDALEREREELEELRRWDARKPEVQAKVIAESRLTFHDLSQLAPRDEEHLDWLIDEVAEQIRTGKRPAFKLDIP